MAQEAKIVEEVIEEVEVEQELEEEGTEIDESEPDGDDEPIAAETPACLEDVPDDDKPEKSIPLGAHIKERDKLKKQRAGLDAENERLRLEIEGLKTTQAPVSQSLKRPRSDDFDTDEEHEAALDKYDEQRDLALLNKFNNNNTQNIQQDRQQKAQLKAVEDHIIRADTFINKNAISPEVYTSADSNIRQAVEAIRPDETDLIVNTLIDVAGDVSEQVWLHLGRSKARLERFKDTLSSDPSGLKTAAFVGEMKKEIKPNKKRTSQAPKPAQTIKGGLPPTGKAKAFKKKYDAAKTPQEAFNLRKEAKAAKIDVKEWS